jgi:hypothetical protein
MIMFADLASTGLLGPLAATSHALVCRPISATKGTTWKEEEDKDHDEDVSILSI